MDIVQDNAGKLTQVTLAQKPQTDLGIATTDISMYTPQASVVMSDSLKGLVNSIQSLKQSIGMLVSQGKTLTEARKQAARERLSMLKQQIEGLKQMLAGMDPEAARAMLAQIKNMSQELRSLAGQLSSGGGGGNGNSSSLDFSGEETSESSEGQVSLDAETSATTEADSVESEVKAIEAEAIESETVAAEAPADQQQNPEEADANVTEEEVLQLLASLASSNSSQTSSSSNSPDKMSKEDADLLGKVRNEFKSLVAMLKQKIQQDDDKNTLNSIEDDLRAVDDSIDQIMSDGVQATLTASYGAFTS